MGKACAKKGKEPRANLKGLSQDKLLTPRQKQRQQQHAAIKEAKAQDESKTAANFEQQPKPKRKQQVPNLPVQVLKQSKGAKLLPLDAGEDIIYQDQLGNPVIQTI